MSFVLDNSVSMRWLLLDGSDADLAYAEKVSLALDSTDCVVPVLWHIELANGITRAETGQLLSPAATHTFLTVVKSLPIIIDEESPLRSLTDTLDLARKYRLTAYDATYLEIAIRLQIAIATLDIDLLKGAKRAGVRRFEP